jgi:hypothetical protein
VSTQYTFLASAVIGISIRRALMMKYKMIPAMKKRRPAPRNGGTLVNPTLMASHVEPHTKQAVAKAMTILARSAMIIEICTLKLVSR